MFQQLAAASGAEALVIGSTLFFMIVFGIVLVRLVTGSSAEYAAHARLPLDDQGHPADAAMPSTAQQCAAARKA